MSHFYGTVNGAARTSASRTGNVASGISAHPRGWDVGVRVWGHSTPEGDRFHVTVTGGSNATAAEIRLADVWREGNGWTVVLHRPDGSSETLNYGEAKA